MSTPPPQPSDESPAGAQQRQPDPKRNLAGVGFVLFGGYVAYGGWGLVDSALWLRVLLVLAGAAGALYGAAQLWQNRRR